jgi:hypothetical protein
LERQAQEEQEQAEGQHQLALQALEDARLRQAPDSREGYALPRIASSANHPGAARHCHTANWQASRKPSRA